MTKVFISYVSADASRALFIQRQFARMGIDVFLAKNSIEPGENWTSRILQALSASDWIFFLASKEACSSPFVLQEVGASIMSKKQLISIVWDMDPADLPGWAKMHQALDLRDGDLEKLSVTMSEIARRIKRNEQIANIILVGFLVAFGFAFAKG